MSIDSYPITIPASGTYLFPNPANFFLLVSSSANCLIQITTGVQRETFSNISAGLKISRARRWDNVTVQALAGTTAVVLLGTEGVRTDDTDVLLTIAAIQGSLSTVPGVGLINAATDHADVVVPATSLDTTIAANAARRTLVVGSLSSNAPATKNLRLQAHPGSAAGGKGIELQPGTFITLPSAAAWDVANPDANAQTYWWEEQT